MGTDAWCKTRGASHCAVVLGQVSVVEEERDTTYVFPKKGTRGTLAVASMLCLLSIALMNSILKRFLRTLVGGQRLRDDAMDYIRQHILLRPRLNCREARAAVETAGFIPIAMEHIVPPVQNAIFIGHVRPRLEDGVFVIRARDAVDLDALSEGPVSVVLSEELREFDVMDLD